MMSLSSYAALCCPVRWGTCCAAQCPLILLPASCGAEAKARLDCFGACCGALLTGPSPSAFGARLLSHNWSVASAICNVAWDHLTVNSGSGCSPSWSLHCLESPLDVADWTADLH